MKNDKNLIDIHVGKRVRTIRVSQDLGMEETAQRLGISVACYRKSERGERRFKASELSDLSRTLRVNVAIFFGALKALEKSISRATLAIQEQGDGESGLTAKVIPLFRQSAEARIPIRAHRRP